MSKNTVRVYDTITKRYVEIEVSEKIRTYYNRTQWNIDDNNKSFYKHEIQFSALKGNINGELENFHEFRTENDDVERRVMNLICKRRWKIRFKRILQRKKSMRISILTSSRTSIMMIFN